MPINSRRDQTTSTFGKGCVHPGSCLEGLIELIDHQMRQGMSAVTSMMYSTTSTSADVVALPPSFETDSHGLSTSPRGARGSLAVTSTTRANNGRKTPPTASGPAASLFVARLADCWSCLLRMLQGCDGGGEEGYHNPVCLSAVAWRKGSQAVALGRDAGKACRRGGGGRATTTLPDTDAPVGRRGVRVRCGPPRLPEGQRPMDEARRHRSSPRAMACGAALAFFADVYPPHFSFTPTVWYT
ncbi:hypothetical protein MRX96_049822 [Rhipicephalus microplus]